MSHPTTRRLSEPPRHRILARRGSVRLVAGGVLAVASAAAGCVTAPGGRSGVTPSPPAGERLRAPEGFYAAARESGDFDGCPPASPPYTGALNFPSKFEGSDSARDDLNPQAQARYERQIADIRRLERGISDLTEAYLRTGDAQAVACAVDWLADWAGADALLGEVTTHTGKSMRKWALGSVASAWLRLKFSTSDPLDRYAAEIALIEPWLGRLARAVQADWADVPLEKFNNHEYWAAWSVAVTAVVLDDRRMMAWAGDRYRTAAQQVTDDGFLPNELARDTRALFYHNYALPPLTMLAAFADANGMDWQSAGDDALDRLARTVMGGVADPEVFASKTGSPQQPTAIKDSKFTWLEPYCALTACAPMFAEKLAATRPLVNYRVGGDVTALFATGN